MSRLMNNLTAFVLAGGKGTRSLDPTKPKILQKIANVSLLELHLFQLERSGIMKAVFSLGFGADLVIAHLARLHHDSQIQTEYFIEKELLGTVNALKIAVQAITEEHCLIILGDILINCDYRQMFDYWRNNSKRKVCVVVHPNLHPGNSDRLILSSSTATEFEFLEKNEPSTVLNDGLALAGVFFVEAQFLKEFLNKFQQGDFSQEITKYAIQNHELFVLNSSYHFSDTGTPERLERAVQSTNSGAVQFRGLREKGAIFLDRDGTLMPDIPEGRVDLSDFEIELDTAQAIAFSNQMGVPVFVVTNQPAIAKGFISESDVAWVHTQMREHFRSHVALIDDIKFCPHHPEKGHNGEVLSLKIKCDCRKPSKGMFEQLSEQHGIKLSNSVVIGDSEVDMGAARAIQARGILAKHGDGSVARAILESVDSIRANYSNSVKG